MFIGEGKFESLISKINEEILLEKRRGGYETPYIIDQLKKYRNGHYYMSFSPDLGIGGKLGINPKNPYNTPTGIYSYPIGVLWDDILHKNLPYGIEKPNIFIFKAKDQSRVVFSSTYRYDKMREDYRKLLYFSSGILPEDVENSYIDHRYEEFREAVDKEWWDNPLAFIWAESRKLSKKNVNKWTQLLYKLYDGIVDDEGRGIIHPNEPTQAIFFNSSAIKVVDLIKNSVNNWGRDFNKTIWSKKQLKKYIESEGFAEKVTLRLHEKIENVEDIIATKLIIINSNIGHLYPMCDSLRIEHNSHIETLDLRYCRYLSIKGRATVGEFINVPPNLVVSISGGKSKIPNPKKGIKITIFNWDGDIDDLPYGDKFEIDSFTLENMGAKSHDDRFKMLKYIIDKNDGEHILMWI